MAGVLGADELVELLGRFGMKVELDPAGARADGVSSELVRARLAHALVGVAQAHASRADDAARQTGASLDEIGEVALMVFAGAGCESEADEWALIQWQTTRLAQVVAKLDFGGPVRPDEQTGSGDVLVRTIREVTAALSGMACAKQAATNPLHNAGEAADAGRALSRAMDALEQAAADAPMHRNVGQLMQMTD